jgi:formate hydrogenlyase subunit 6/NADH:ubiquinone oxidoreductase subunit I
MSIVRLLLQNLRGGSITLPFPERPPIQGQYRGMVRNQPEECTGCGLCAYVCTSSAIKVQRVLDGFQWSYDPGQCTFCARCVQRCPKHSLEMQGIRPPVYQLHGALKQSYDIKKKKPGAAAPKSEFVAAAPQPEPAEAR